MVVQFFESPDDFRKWLENNHMVQLELWVGYYKVTTGKPSVTYANALDEALCFGWIDGLRKSIDEISYCIRFTPRKPNSIWSAVNIKKVENLIEMGKMTQAGLEAYQKKADLRTQIYSYENKPEHLSAGMEEKFRKNSKAWDFFIQQSASYQKMTNFYVMSAKQEATKFSRLSKLIEACEKGIKLY